MFTANITGKSFKGGVLQIVVSYTNGSETLQEAINVTSEANLNSQIAQRVEQLNQLEQLAVKVSVGAWTKPTEVTETLTELQIATQTLSDLKRLIELGVLKETDPEFVAAVVAYKTAASK